MKEILMMVLEDCPYFSPGDPAAMRLGSDATAENIAQLREENEKYRGITVKRVDEEADPGLAETLDYYYVPCFFVEGKKLLEGVPEKEKVQAVLDAALAEG